MSVTAWTCRHVHGLGWSGQWAHRKDVKEHKDLHDNEECVAIAKDRAPTTWGLGCEGAVLRTEKRRVGNDGKYDSNVKG